MRLRKFMRIAFGTVVFLLFAQACLAADWHLKKVSQVQVHAGNGCLYFTLEGVTEADPVVSGQPWFTLEPENTHQKEFLSLLMLAYASKTNVKVATTGKKTSGCGYAQILYVRLQ